MRRLAISLAALVFAHTAAAQAPTTSWKRGATCYEIFVRSFADSDGDGIGDLRGITARLDYLNDGNPRTTTDLGVRCIWLMPVAASPSYHGYDVSDYYRVNPQYGTAADFTRLVAAAHRRGIKVLVDLVLNHASNQHPYFQEALRDTASPHRSWFRFSATKPDTRGIWGQTIWHKSPVRDEYYYGLFSSEMPDLNYETPAVRSEATNVARFWLKQMGVDGFRLDAISFLVEDSTRVDHTAGTHAVLREFSRNVKRISPAAFTIGEVWDSIGAQLPYYPDQLDAHFTFEASDALLDAARTGSARKLLAPFLRMQHALPPDRWSPFLHNHDQTRTMTALGGDLSRVRLATTLLLTLPGLPFLYYGEEIGMSGDKPDPQLRTPMQWTGGRAGGFTTGSPWAQLRPDSATANVQAQDRDRASLLNLHRRLIHLRAQNGALGGGELIPLDASNDAVAAYLRRDGTRIVMVVANLGATALSGVTVSSRDSVMRRKSYSATSLLGAGAPSRLVVGASGRVSGYVPLAWLPARQAYVLALR